MLTINIMIHSEQYQINPMLSISNTVVNRKNCVSFSFCLIISYDSYYLGLCYEYKLLKL